MATSAATAPGAGSDPAGLGPDRPSLVRRLGGERRLIAAVFAVVILAAWELYARTSTSVFEIPSPTSTVAAAREMWASGELWQAMKESGWVLVSGAVPALVIGILLGLVIGTVRALDIAFSPYIFAFYATPFVALIPLFLLLFGIGYQGKVAIVFALVVVATLLQTIAGVRDVDRRLLEVARSLRVPGWRTMFEIRLPAALPLIIAGIRYAIGRALIGVVVAEFDTAFAGLGAEIFRHSQRLQLSKAFVPAVVLGIAGMVLNAALRRTELRLQRWVYVD